jgi:2-dehydropantoate 2-reductase
MKIAVVGVGAVGGYYGAMLARAGENVHFLLRSDYDTVKVSGLSIVSPHGNFVLHPKVAKASGDIGPVDTVLIALKTTANDQFQRLLTPLAHPGTMFVTLQNGLGNEEELSRLFGRDRIVGGLCFVCLNRVAPGVIHHLDHGQIVLGEFTGPSQPRTHDLAARFVRAGVPCKVAENLARVHWEKLVWNIPFNGLGVASASGYEATIAGALPSRRPGPCLTTDRLLGDPRWRALVRELMLEVISTARALGHDIPETLADKQIERTATMGAYKASTLIDFERGQPLEIRSLFLDPLECARSVGVATPRLQALCTTLSRLASPSLAAK